MPFMGPACAGGQLGARLVAWQVCLSQAAGCT